MAASVIIVNIQRYSVMLWEHDCQVFFYIDHCWFSLFLCAICHVYIKWWKLKKICLTIWFLWYDWLYMIDCIWSIVYDRLYIVVSCLRIFHSYKDVTIASEGMLKLGSALPVIDQGGIFTVPYLLWNRTWVDTVSS